MEIYWCRKWGFCPINGSLNYCLAQNRHQGCKNLIRLPTEHPKKEQYSAKRERRQQRKALRNLILPGGQPGKNGRVAQQNFGAASSAETAAK
jgi:hypothetical protein